jgi:hypothetical protein
VSQAFFCFNSQLQALVEFQARLQLLKLCEHHDHVRLEAAFLLCNHQSIHHLWRTAKQIFIHTQEDRKSTKSVDTTHVCLSVRPARTPNYSFVDLSEQTKQSSKSFKDSSLNRRKQKFLYFEICSMYRSSQRTL